MVFMKGVKRRSFHTEFLDRFERTSSTPRFFFFCILLSLNALSALAHSKHEAFSPEECDLERTFTHNTADILTRHTGKSTGVTNKKTARSIPGSSVICFNICTCFYSPTCGGKRKKKQPQNLSHCTSWDVSGNPHQRTDR